MAIEIERKYLLNGLPDIITGEPCITVNAGYIPGTSIEERIRETEYTWGEIKKKWYRSIKSGEGIERIEIEERISELLFYKLWPATEGHRVYKKRFFVSPSGVQEIIDHTKLQWEIDIFLDRPSLYLAEIEIPNKEFDVKIPKWLEDKIIKEVTFDPEYKNSRLAK